ncbi:uncharacterized protein LOC123897261 [Trifolium pratense]|uniref:uncharacterized protein LOC123897261 n=1 Tax=Trifolium pratense TaxID=57577 RepID=UPI001E692B5C|nr:uncharacterized protein LOC123897261 [Trifolium pratense]
MCPGRRFFGNVWNSSMFKDVKGGFATVTMNFMERYAEVDPKFVEEFKEELGGILRLKDECGNRHIVKFNNSVTTPDIFEGMTELRQFYGLTGSHLLLFGYKGNNKFSLTVFKKEVDEFSFPAFHSQSSMLSDKENAYICIKLCVML